MAPWLQSGAGALTNLNYLLGIQQPSSTTPGANGNGAGTNAAGAPVNVTSTPNASLGGFGSLNAAYPGGQFVAPTAQEALNSPGEQAQLQLGTQALQQSAAAKGNLLTGGTAEALNGYAQNLASTGYQNAYNNAYNTYSSNYNQYENGQANTYNRLASLAGMGQTTASQLGTLGANEASSVSNNLTSTAAQMGQDTQNAAAANASGVVGSANAWNGALGNASSSASNLALLQQLTGGSNSYGSLPNYQPNNYGYDG